MSRLIAVGSIRGNYTRLSNLMDLVKPSRGDRFVFLGDYAGGDQTAEVIEYLIDFGAYRDAVFLMGMNDSMFLDYLKLSTDENLVGWNGQATVDSYISEVPRSHVQFLSLLNDHYIHDAISYTVYIMTNGMLDPRVSPMESIASTRVFWNAGKERRAHSSWNKGFFNIFSNGQHKQPKFLGRSFLSIDTGCGIQGGPLTACEVPRSRNGEFKFFVEDSCSQ